MTEDETVVAETIVTTGEPKTPIVTEPQEDYRGKLNATNSFLKKEGYTFNEESKRWEKPATPATPTEPSKEEKGLSALDAVLIAKADVAAEDIDEVIEFANYRKLTIADALKNKTLKTILDERTEERRTAQATQIKGSPRGTTKVTGEDLLKKAEETGEVPETEEGMAMLHEARMAKREAKHQK